MAQRCEITKRGPLSGNNVSHSKRRTKRTWKVNLVTKRLEINGKVRKVKLSTKAFKALTKPQRGANKKVTA